MSRIGKKVIAIPQGTEIKADAGVLTVKGPKGTLTRPIPQEISVKIENGTVSCVFNAPEGQEPTPLWGTFTAHIANMIKGTNENFQKKLILEGIGFKSEVKGENLALSLGFSHPVSVPIQKGLKVTAEKNIITISGVDRDQVGQFAAEVRDLKKPEPYKGKGMRYEGEVIRRKEGKKTV